MFVYLKTQNTNLLFYLFIYGLQVIIILTRSWHDMSFKHYVTSECHFSYLCIWIKIEMAKSLTTNTRVFFSIQIYLENNFRKKNNTNVCCYNTLGIYALNTDSSLFPKCFFFKLLVIYSHFFSFLWFVFLAILNDYYIPLY